MRHEHLVVTVEAETKAAIDEDLEPGESLESWVADAVEAKLSEESDDAEANDRDSGRASPDPDEDQDSEPDDRYSDEDRYAEGFEYVDDCAI